MAWTKIPKAVGGTWTKIAKPSDGGTITINAGNPIGLLLALTYSTTSTVTTTKWTKLIKATNPNWTKVPKAT